MFAEKVLIQTGGKRRRERSKKNWLEDAKEDIYEDWQKKWRKTMGLEARKPVTCIIKQNNYTLSSNFH